MIWSIIYLILDLIWLGIAVAISRNYVWTSDGVTIQSGSAVSTAAFAIYGVSIAVRILTLVGAGIYNKWMVGLGALWEIIAVILAIVLSVTKPATVYWSNGYSSGTYTTSPALTIIFTLIFSGLLFYVSSYIVWFEYNFTSTTYTKNNI